VRLRQLDVLRGIAVMLVLFRHHPGPEPGVTASVRIVGETLQRMGWIGVDLFFVLSGFLVSGLLFGEYRAHGGLWVGRFLARRGFKIYPAFYLLLMVTWLMQRYGGDAAPTDAATLFRNEAFYLQNYLGGVWNHTWSLAVEEHFYLLLPIILMVTVAPAAVDPFRRTAVVLLGLCLAILSARIATVHAPYDFLTHLFPTHLRIDSLLWGVLLAYLFHFRDRAWLPWLRRHALIVMPIAALLVTPAFRDDVGSSIVLGTWGLTSIALGFTLLLALTLAAAGAREGAGVGLPYAGVWLATIGFDSYSIYLWHMPVQRWITPWYQRAVLPQTSDPTVTYLVGLGAYLTAAVVVGVIMARLVERPALALRDRLVPSRTGRLVVATPDVPTVADVAVAGAGS
jgi:peptidoglycan/LPS O-acetylase OafA/YrhL